MINQLLEEIKPLQDKLLSHPIYGKVQSLDQLNTFMSLHVYSVWDFMSLVKFLQSKLAPAAFPWKPVPNQKLVHFINDIVLEEESDVTPDGRHMSHFEMYCLAMGEVNIDADKAFSFAQSTNLDNLDDNLNKYELPLQIQNGIKQTFNFLNSDKPHIAASAFCFGRENIIPLMFQELLDKMNIKEDDAPLFHYYLSRHIQLDGEVHGPMAIEMVETLCNNSEENWNEAIFAAKEAIQARINLWDFILEKIESNN